MTDYEPLTIKAGGKEPRNHKAYRERLYERCPGLEFYLRKLVSLPFHDDQAKIDRALAEWESSAPRPFQRREALSYEYSDNPVNNLIFYGRLSGTGKTTTAYERIWCGTLSTSGFVCETDAIAMTGHEFARRVSCQALKLDTLMQDLTDADTLLIDDLDKRSTADGKFSAVVQQSLFDLIEARTTRPYHVTVLTLNASGPELAAKFDDDIAPYFMRRLRERFRAIDFDPLVQPDNVLPMEAHA